jgi:hypothetical protein
MHLPMNEKHIAAIALSNDVFPSFRAKLDDALRWLELAAGMGCDHSRSATQPCPRTIGKLTASHSSTLLQH